MGAPFTLQQLMAAQTLPDLKVQFLALLQAEGFPAITEWAGEPTGTEMSFVEMVCRFLDQAVASGAPEEQRIASVAAGQHLGLATGGWQDLIAEQDYLLPREDATRTTFTMRLAADANADPNTFQPGDIWLVGPTGKRYQSTSGGQLAPASTLAVDFAAEEVGSTYSDPASTLSLVTGFAGVTLLASAGDFSVVSSSGVSSGIVQPRRTDDAVAPVAHDFAIKIVSSGDVGAATWSISVDGGPFVFQGALLSTIPLADGTTIVSENGESSPSFVADDVFEFSTPDTAHRIQGDDAESGPRLAQRCRDRWPNQALNVTDGKVRLWVSAAVPSVNRVRIQPDRVKPGRFIVTAADSHGALDAVSVQAIETFVRARLNNGEGMDAVSAQPIFTYATGSVIVPSSMNDDDLEGMKHAVDDAWVAYLGTVDIGPSEVRLARLVDLLIDAGAEDATGLVFSAGGATWPINVSVPDGFVPEAKPPISTTLTWRRA